MNRRALAVLERLRALYPEARCELDYRDPFELLVATILSAQCTDKRVNQVTPALFARFPDAARLARARQEEVEELVKTCGFFRSKARNLIAAARAVAEEHGGKVPDAMEALTALPGVGRKTANVVLSNAYGVPAIAVDTHVGRVSRRLGLARGKTPEEVERELTAAFPKRDWSEAHHLLIWHGRRVCRARGPLCDACPAATLCDYYKEARRKAPASKTAKAEARRSRSR